MMQLKKLQKLASLTCWMFKWYLNIFENAVKLENSTRDSLIKQSRLLLNNRMKISWLISIVFVALYLLTRYLQNQSTGPVTLGKDGNVAIKIQAKPGAKCNNVTGK